VCVCVCGRVFSVHAVLCCAFTTYVNQSAFFVPKDFFSFLPVSFSYYVFCFLFAYLFSRLGYVQENHIVPNRLGLSCPQLFVFLSMDNTEKLKYISNGGKRSFSVVDFLTLPYFGSNRLGCVWKLQYPKSDSKGVFLVHLPFRLSVT